jgi:hypothetical protein
MGFFKKAEAFLQQWLINPWMSYGVVGETGLLEERL